jgi:hypothetical protein
MPKFTPSYEKLKKRRAMQEVMELKSQESFGQQSLFDELGPKDPETEEHEIVDEQELARVKSRELDQFYTRPEVAEKCMDKIREIVPVSDIRLWIEPSAGTGVFFGQLPNPKRGFDIDKAHAGKGVEIRNFLEWNYREVTGPVAVVGNPPFGKNSSLALEFIKRASLFADWICMILPRTFEKETMQNKIPRGFELVEESIMVLEPFSFMHNDEPYDVPCCFQIWKKLPPGQIRGMHRQVRNHPDFTFVNDPKDADFAFQRVGGKAGLASKEGLTRSYKSNHFIKASEGVDWKKLMDDFNAIDWKSISEKTAGNPSISKGEMIAAISVIRPPRTDTDTSRLDLLDNLI